MYIYMYIYISHRLAHHIQDEALHNERMLEDTLLVCSYALIWKFLAKYGNINSIFHSENFLQIINVEVDL